MHSLSLQIKIVPMNRPGVLSAILTMVLLATAYQPAHAQFFNKDKEKAEEKAEPTFWQKVTGQEAEEKAEPEPASLKERLFGKDEARQDLKEDHKDAKKEYRTLKKERKAAEAREEAAKARKKALQAEKKAVRKEKKADRIDRKVDKAYQKQEKEEGFLDTIFGGN
jgi:chromosome segregation ATPase